MNPLTPADIDAVCDLVHHLCGISWDESKSYLMESRLQGLVERAGCTSYADFARQVRATLTPALTAEVIDAVTTGETRWFRDPPAFEALKYKIIPELIDAKAATAAPRRLRIWSAACSTGQEPYSIAMALAEAIPGIAQWDVQIMGTDISPAAIAHASRAVYSQSEIERGIDAGQLNLNFRRDGDQWRLRDEIRALCTFAVHNLHAPFAGLGPFDIVFCRNVAIYFSETDRRNVFERLATTLTPQGWLVTGSSESLADLGPRWAPQFHCRATWYRPRLLTPA